MTQHEDSQFPQGSAAPHLRNTPTYAVRYKHRHETRERCTRFTLEANARQFFERLRISMHPAEERPIEWVELTVRHGVGPREVLAYAPEGGAR